MEGRKNSKNTWFIQINLKCFTLLQNECAVTETCYQDPNHEGKKSRKQANMVVVVVVFFYDRLAICLVQKLI